jgi:hypothetical protein
VVRWRSAWLGAQTFRLVAFDSILDFSLRSTFLRLVPPSSLVPPTSTSRYCGVFSRPCVQEACPERVEALGLRPTVSHSGNDPCGHFSSDWQLFMSWLYWPCARLRNFAYSSTLAIRHGLKRCLCVWTGVICRGCCYAYQRKVNGERCKARTQIYFDEKKANQALCDTSW